MPVCEPYEQWMKAQQIPIYRDYYVEDARTLKLEPWTSRQCNAAFLQLVGQEGIVEAQVIEVPPGQTLPPVKKGVDELIYVIGGNGATSVWTSETGPRQTFEWGPYSLFMIPANCWFQVANMSGNQPARLLHYNYLPAALTANPDIDFFLDNPYGNTSALSREGGEFYSEAKAVREEEGAMRGGGRVEHYWIGNFFPNLKNWDRLSPYYGRGAGGHVVHIKFPKSEIPSHMSVFPSRTYKKAHRHGPGTVIVIPAGEGYSVMWAQGGERIVVPWHEGSIFVPPSRWFHQHFNLGAEPARYLALSGRILFRTSSAGGDDVVDATLDQIGYTDEDSWTREFFEGQLAERSLASLMPDAAYHDPDYEWDYAAVAFKTSG